MANVHPVHQPHASHRYYQMHTVVVYALLLALFSVVTRPTAWGGCSVANICLGAFFFYHFMTRAQLGLLEFTLTLVVLGHSLILTVQHLWPFFRNSEVDWFILPATLGVAVWVLGGALWCGWVVQALQMTKAWDRIHVLLVGWLVPVALPGLLASLFLTFTGLPTYMLQHVGLRKSHMPYVIYDWWVLLTPIAAVVCYRMVAQAWGLHAAARAIREDEEHLIEDAARFGAPVDPIAPDPRAAPHA